MSFTHESFDVERAALSLWGKSARLGAPRPHLLLQHLYDTLAVGELIWDEYLGDPVRRALDAATADRGRQFFAFLCGAHDVGKATPKFQSKSDELAGRVRGTGLTWSRLSERPAEWHHTRAGARILRDECCRAGWLSPAIGWTWPMVGGHHGTIPSTAMTNPSKICDDHGRTSEWREVQRWLLERVAVVAGFHDLADAGPTRAPSIGVQLAISGSIIMADWLASNQARFPPVDDPGAVSVDAARSRAADAWREFDLRTGISHHELPDDLVVARFGKVARPLQVAAARMAAVMPAAGLVIIEAPMGEGKTEAALAAAEILAQRFGLRGIFVGMPTQATSDPMFDRVRRWAEAGAAPGAPIMLLHGKRMFNPHFATLLHPQHFGPTYEDESVFGATGNAYGIAHRERTSAAVADWFLGRKRGLLSPLTVGTIDNLLHAGTLTPHVMLRHTGLAQKVVILDEVHAASVYMSQFLLESLRWLGSAGAPVVLLTATLPPSLRHDAVRRYLEGAGTVMPDLPPTGYPSVIAVGAADGRSFALGETTQPWREPVRVRVEPLRNEDDATGDRIAERLASLLAGGGTALVIRNTVDRAQQTYRKLVEVFDDGVELLHARLTVGERAERADAELRRLGPSPEGVRPTHVLVATQVAEQSFDVDVDVLITDLAPIDLLLQRIGRVHRHERGKRPAAVSIPAVFVTGLTIGDGVPEFPRGSEFVYGRFRLLRAAALVLAASQSDGWVIPTDIPGLVAVGYGNEPTAAEVAWPEVAAEAYREHLTDREKREHDASDYLLVQAANPLPGDLSSLHSRVVNAGDDVRMDAIVRDGEPSAEVVLVRRGSDGEELTLSGRVLSAGGVMVGDTDVIAESLASIVRLPAGAARGKRSLTEAVGQIPIPAGWLGHAYLRFLRPLVFDDDLVGEVGGRTFRYDHRLGLVEVRT